MGYYEATDEGGWWSCPHCYGTINALEGVPFAPAEPAATVTECMVDIMQEAIYDDVREGDRPVIRAALEAALNGGTE